MQTLIIVLALGVIAIAAAITWVLLKPTNPTKRYHVFFATLRINGLVRPLYLCGDRPGTEAFPSVPLMMETDWRRVTVKGFRTRDEAWAAALKRSQQHETEVLAAQKAMPWPGKYKVSPCKIDPGLDS